ncbi:Hypothetical_protein [Hexamita inflata]|uniref:Hypothetical_protein n=1 Tax=Hexamita inflata TaxID=28002 RepID=A0AA86U4G0_9EUKA|nr:Hypothetical protein HINF_LOCUS26836 [Hexamita inflata]
MNKQYNIVLQEPIRLQTTCRLLQLQQNILLQKQVNLLQKLQKQFDLLLKREPQYKALKNKKLEFTYKGGEARNVNTIVYYQYPNTTTLLSVQQQNINDPI